MDAVGILRSFHGTTAPAQSYLDKPAVLPAQSASLCNVAFPQASVTGGRSIFSTRIQNRSFLPLLKASEATIAATSGDASEKISGPPGKESTRNSTFPNGLENLLLEVCDETEVAELKLKVGDFEMHLKRNIGALESPPHIVSPITAPPIPSEPMVESVHVAPPVAHSVSLQKSSQVSINPFSNVTSEKSVKLAALEASGTNTYVLVSSPAVGLFKNGITIKGKTLPPSCEEGALIKEGQTIGYLDQMGSQVPVKSDVTGEVLKILCEDGDAIGYGDPLLAVLPSFPGINN